MPSEGEHIGPYELQRRLGGGAFGEVWLARHVELDAPRAVKIPTDPEYVAQLRREGRIQVSLKHPNIVETVDLHTTGDTPYFVMEYVEGTTLREHLAARGKLPPAEALPLLAQVLDALAAAHEAGVVHRDLKPENILLTPDGTAKVTDFGLGRVQADVATSLLLSGSLRTVEGQSVSGTFAYMSPEQQLGKPPSPQDDVYAAGVIACEMLTGQRPSGVGVAKLFGREGVPPALTDVVERALDDAAHRTATAGEMLAALRRATGGQAPPPGPPSLPPAPPPTESPTVAERLQRLLGGPAPGASESWGNWLQRSLGLPSAVRPPDLPNVPTWGQWLGSRHNRAGQVWGGIALSLTALLLMGFLAAAGGHMDEEEALGGAVLLSVPLWVGFVVALVRSRNRYLLHCAEVCLAEGKFRPALPYVRKLKAFGVDRGRAASVLEGLARLGERDGQAEGARTVRHLLATRWAGPGPPPPTLPLDA